MHDGPSAAELAEAVREFLESEVLPVAQDARLRFRVLVAANALSIVKRDLEVGDSLLAEEVSLLAPLVGPPPAGTPRQQALALSAKLCSLIRDGDVPGGTLTALRRVAELKLRAASPRYLQRER